VVSNRVNTKYYANTERQSFKQAFYWAREDNRTIRELTPFAATFFQPLHLGEMIGKYMVLNETNKILKVLRPYQVYADVAIVDRVKTPPPVDKNGYVWHTTGSGKTLTSFKAAQILVSLPDVYKVVFVVDRMEINWPLLFFPSLFFASTLFALNFLGDGLRDALDPKSAKD
jgi:type I restriction enzyme, R subunit